MRRAAAFTLVVFVSVGVGAAGAPVNTVAAPRVQDVAAAPAMTPQAMEALLREGKIVERKTVTKGTTGAFRVTLTDGTTTHDAQVQSVDIFKAVFDVDPKHTEFNFRDTYRYNIAAYRLARLLGIGSVPMSVQRTVDGKPSAVTWWVDDVAMDEGGRMKLAPAVRMGPDTQRTTGFGNIVRVFDELIQNRDRNSGNLLWTKDWSMWMIDHTRAFRTDGKLLDPASLDRCERGLFTALKTLTRATLTSAVGDSLLKIEVDALLTRRDLIVKLFDSKIAQRGEEGVLYTMPR